MPLVIMLHGYGSPNGGLGEESNMQIEPYAESRGFLYCHPDGTIDQWGYHFWKANDVCCDWGNTGVDDAGYLRSLLDEIPGHFAVDRKRIYLVGHSNGGMMAYRMASLFADRIAGIAILDSTPFLDLNPNTPSAPVNLVHIHGTADEQIPYQGGALIGVGLPANLPAVPGARQAVQMWADYNGATDPVTEPTPSLDLTTDIVGLDTIITRYGTSLPGGAVELWTINGGDHVPNLTAQFAPKVIDWLVAHPKP
jgi:polyhydroxybutyrate depolymerase